MSFLDKARELAEQAGTGAAKIRDALGGLLILDSHHPDGHYRGTDTAAQADYYSANPDELRRRLERGQDL